MKISAGCHFGEEIKSLEGSAFLIAIAQNDRLEAAASFAARSGKARYP